MKHIDPCIIDTLAFSGLSETEMRDRALSTRDNLGLYDHEFSYIRYRLLMKNKDKPTLVVLPDAPATIESYDDFISTLGDRYNIAIIEIPGFGFSFPKHPKALEFEESCQITSAVIASLNLPQAILVGPCIQGLIALRIGQIIPESISGIIALQTGDIAAEQHWSGKTLDTKGHLARPFEGQIMFRKTREKATIDIWTATVAGSKLDLIKFQNEARKIQNMDCCYALASTIQKWARVDPESNLTSSVPTAFIWGLADASHRHTHKASIKSYAPAAQYIEREDLGHFPDLEDPSLIGEIAHDLLNTKGIC